MNPILALLIQAGGMSKDPSAHPPGDENGFSKVMIMIFIVTMAVGIAVVIAMIFRGAAGATKAKLEEEGKE